MFAGEVVPEVSAPFEEFAALNTDVNLQGGSGRRFTCVRGISVSHHETVRLAVRFVCTWTVTIQVNTHTQNVESGTN